jgi:Zn-dependent protease
MDDQITTLLLSASLFGWLFFAAALSWPRKRERQFSFQRVIAAPPETIWNIYRVDLDDPQTAAFHDKTISINTLRQDPEIREHVVDASGGHGTHLTTVRCETLAEERPRFRATRIREIDDSPYPFGRGMIEALKLEPHPRGTLASLTWRGETKTLWQAFAIWHVLRGYLVKLERFCESGGAAPAARKGGSFAASLALSAVAVGSFALWLGWLGALLLTGVLIAHEFGHWLAMRLTGQPAPRILLIPFFGGVAVANQPHRTLFDDAFCSLMGPGFSVLPSLACLLAAAALGAPDAQAWFSDGAAFSWQEGAGVIAALVGLAVGGLNLLQLVPVLPLDGGQILRAAVQSLSAARARHILLGVTGLGIVGLAYTGDFLLAGVLVLGALQAWHMGGAPSKARPMSGAGLAVIGLGYGLTLAVHGAAVFYGLPYIGIQVF